MHVALAHAPLGYSEILACSGILQLCECRQRLAGTLAEAGAEGTGADIESHHVLGRSQLPCP